MAEHINTDSFHSCAHDTPPAFVLQAAWFPAIQSRSLAKVWEGFFSSTEAKCKTTAGAPATESNLNANQEFLIRAVGTTGLKRLPMQKPSSV